MQTITEEGFHFSRIPMGYAGQQIDRGQVFMPKPGARNNARMVEQGHMAAVEIGADVYECGRCGAGFISDMFRNAHGRLRHSNLTPQQEDAMLDRMDEQIAQAGEIKAPRAAELKHS